VLGGPLGGSPAWPAAVQFEISAKNQKIKVLRVAVSTEPDALLSVL